MEIQLFDKNTISKSQIQDISLSLIDKLDTGEIPALLLKAKFKALEDVGEKIKETLRKACITEADKYGKEEILVYGATFKQGEFGQKFDFESTGDPVWLRLKEASEKATKALKDREAFLKTIKGHETIVDTETSEIVTITEPVKSSTTVVQCSIK